MKVIFLDIDGVMNSQIYYRERASTWSHKIKVLRGKIRSWYKFVINGFEHKGVSLRDYRIPDEYYCYENQLKRLLESTSREKWEWLAEFCNTYEIKICISSVWKYNFRRREDLGSLFNDAGWRRALISLGFVPDTYVGTTGKRRDLRGTEIQEWLDAHPEVEQYAIIDDDCDMLPEQMDNFFQTDGYVGLTPTTIYKLWKHFKT